MVRFFALLIVISSVASANELYLDRRHITTSDVVTITVALDGEFASLADVNVPLQNLAVDGAPSVSTSYTIINGSASHQRTMRYVARPLGAGRAVVGPIVLQLPDGQRDTLPAVAVDVSEDRAAGSNDPLTVLRGLVAEHRPAIFVVGEVDRTDVYAGQEVVVTWRLYSAALVEQWGISEGPKLSDFWSEEIPISGESPRRVILGDMLIDQLPIRRVALFPLRDGTLTVGPLTIEAAVMMRERTADPFGAFEGRVDGVRWRSAPITINVKPLPPGSPVDAAGDLVMRCAPPAQQNGGPVVVNVTLTGRGNLRAATPPRFNGAVDGTLQIGEGKVSVNRTAGEAVMTRTWRYLIFPSHTGEFRLAEFVANTIASSGERQQLRCEAKTLYVEEARDAGGAPAGEAIAPHARAADLGRILPMLLGALLAAIALLIAWPRVAAARARRREVDALLGDGAPAEVRVAVGEWLRARNVDVAKLADERSDRADAWRALRSLTDALEQERIAFDARELRARVSDVVAAATIGRR